MKHRARPILLLLTLCLLLTIGWTTSGLSLVAQPAQQINLERAPANRIINREQLFITITPTPPGAPSTTPPARPPTDLEINDKQSIAPGVKDVVQDLRPGPEDLNPGDRQVLDRSKLKLRLDIDWKGLRWIRHGYVTAPDSLAPGYDEPRDDADIVILLPHRTHLYNFAPLPKYPGWYVIDQHMRTMKGPDQLVYIRAANVELVPDPFADVIKDIFWWEGIVEKLPGGVPVYDGPGTEYPVIYSFEGGGVNGGALWPPDHNWVVIYLNELLNKGYGDGRGFVEAKYFTQGERPAK